MSNQQQQHFCNIINELVKMRLSEEEPLKHQTHYFDSDNIWLRSNKNATLADIWTTGA